MTLVRRSPCKVNLLLNILGRRPDGLHELETILQPVPLCDELSFVRINRGVELTCNHAALPTGPENLVHRAATAFLSASGVKAGVLIHLDKRVPLAAGLGGGSSNAAHTLGGLNELFNHPLPATKLTELAASLGSDVPFFLQDMPALGTGRGEQVQSLEPFDALRGAGLLLIHPGFGISTPWAYQELARFPKALHGEPGRAGRLIQLLKTNELIEAGGEFYNSLEAPAFSKYPILALFQEFLRANGAAVALMSGSGSTTFALTHGKEAAGLLREKFRSKFGQENWTAVVTL